MHLYLEVTYPCGRSGGGTEFCQTAERPESWRVNGSSTRENFCGGDTTRSHKDEKKKSKKKRGPRQVEGAVGDLNSRYARVDKVNFGRSTHMYELSLEGGWD